MRTHIYHAGRTTHISVHSQIGRWDLGTAPIEAGVRCTSQCAWVYLNIIIYIWNGNGVYIKQWWWYIYIYICIPKKIMLGWYCYEYTFGSPLFSNNGKHILKTTHTVRKISPHMKYLVSLKSSMHIYRMYIYIYTRIYICIYKMCSVYVYIYI